MMQEKTLNLPACCTVMTEEEMQYTEGGGAVEAVLGGVLAVGVSAVLLYIGGVAVKGIFGGLNSETIGSAVDSAKNAVGNIASSLS